MSWFVWNGKHSAQLGITVVSLPPITRAPKRYEITEIDGMDGAYIDELGLGTYEETLSIGFEEGKADIEEILAMFDEEGQLITSNEPNRYYICNVYETIEFIKSGRIYNVDIKLLIQPYKYNTAETIRPFEAGIAIETIGTNAIIYPKIEITPVLYKNEIIIYAYEEESEKREFFIELDGIEDKFIIDSDSITVKTESGIDLLSKVSGKFPYIEKNKKTMVTVSGEFSEAVLVMRERYL